MVTSEGTEKISLDEVSVVVAYKIDELTTDLVCCDIVAGPEGDEQIRTIHEEISGFENLMTRLEALPGFDRKWREAVILPPFAENRTIIYKRRDNIF
ncbi:hypothetical protein A8B73_02965 [Methylosinus sp. 3S-1]|nr:hypothetical protein A8B73_02965 [Methylosinus sp. 3S-1]